MSAHQAKIRQSEIVNGLEIEKIKSVIGQINEDTRKASWVFHSENEWKGGAVNQSAFKNFYALGEENTSRQEPFILSADEPPALSGNDSAPNPVEYLLHALTSCLTTSLVAHAAVRGIVIESVKTSTEGDLDIRGFLGLSSKVRKGYEAIRIRMRVKSQASAEQLKELAQFSPVYDVVSRAVPVDLVIEKV
jgi:uncharacterized OsmC-like protein